MRQDLMPIEGEHDGRPPGFSGDLLYRLLPEAGYEHPRIRSRWLAANDSAGFTWRDALGRYWPLLAAGTAGLLLLGFAYVRLRAEVRERKRTEQLLARRVRFQQTLLESLPYPVLVKDTALRYIEVNSAFEAYTVPREQLIGRTAREVKLLGPDLMADLDTLASEVLETMASQRREFRIPGPDGRWHDVIYVVAPFRDGDGAPAGVIGTGMDVTDIKEAQARAERLEARIDSLIRALPVAMYEVRRAASGHITFPYVAGNVDAAFGMTQAEMRAGKIPFHAGDLAALGAALRRSSRQLTPLDLECRILGRHGEQWVRIVATPRRVADATVWQGIAIDATASRELAQRLREARDAATSASREKGRFLAAMSHEIRTPLYGVLGLVEVLGKSSLDDKQRRLVALTEESGQALLVILNDILDYAKIEAGQVSMVPVPLDLRELVDNAMGLMLARAAGKGLRCEIHVDGGVAARHLADGVRIRQILLNLLGNAIKFTAHGRVSLSVALVAAGGQAQTVRFAVTDTGIGIAPGMLSQLFSPFAQGDQVAPQHAEGTGLGLVISRRLAQMMGGRLDLDSEEGVGTVAGLELTLPVDKVSHERPAGLSTLTVAVRDAATRRAAVDYARAAGLTVAPAAADGDAGVPASGLWLGECGAPSQPEAGLLLCAPDGARTWQLPQHPFSWMALRHALREAAQACPAGKVQPQAPLQGGAHVLVAEDYPINRELICHQLGLLGYRSTACADGLQALQALDTQAFDAILTDCSMLNLDGYALAEAVRRRERDARAPPLPVIGITANILSDDHARCYAAGMNSLVLKPTTLEALQAGIEQAFRACGRVPSAARNWAAGAAGAALAADANPQPAEGVQAPELDLSAFLATAGGGTGTALIEQALASVRQDREALRTLLSTVDDISHEAALRRWVHGAGGALLFIERRTSRALLERLAAAVKQRDAAATRQAGQNIIGLMNRIEAELRASLVGGREQGGQHDAPPIRRGGT